MTNKLITLKEAYKDYFKIGVAVNPDTLKNDGELIRTQFNSLTAENLMKPEELQPEEGRFTFEGADQIVQFAKENGMAMRGHTLLWHNQTPDWFFKDGDKTASRELALERMKTHIDTVLERYTDGFYAWDVVNEVIEDKGTDILRQSQWLEVVGEDFIEKAFQFAREASPEMGLFINDYNESHPEKRDKYYTLIKQLVDKGTPIDGVGLQAHWGLEDPSLDNIRAAIEKYASLGLTLQVTEMDVSVFNYDDRRTDLTEPTSEMLEKQAERYDAFFKLFREYSEHIDSVTLWAASDRYNWLNDFPVRGRKNWPMLFDENNQPKESFNRITAFK
ncbi:endo-1,4-beta-xylanase [Alkalibacterium iburiense]|uniref:Beta-xylanase n=1 Tax=Alkalibacterium iburiense TaxID=290589 RepID=A0ABN0X9P9_9LACT